MSRDPYLRLEDILEAGISIQSYLEGYYYSSFVEDRKTVDAVTRNLEIVGEAVKHLPPEWKDQADHIPWRAIAGFRDVLAHSYFRAEDSIIWDAATQHLPSLLDFVHTLLDRKNPEA